MVRRQRKGILLLISGPSGVGKSTLIEQMLSDNPELQSVVTATSRQKRVGEKNGKPYFFMNEKEFLQKAKAGYFFETIKRHGAMYGTPKNEIKRKLSGARDLIMHIDWHGRRKLVKLVGKRLKKSIISVFLKPKNILALRQRLQHRGRNSSEEIKLRLSAAHEDLIHSKEYDYAYTSGSYEQDLNHLKSIYLAEKLKV